LDDSPVSFTFKRKDYVSFCFRINKRGCNPCSTEKPTTDFALQALKRANDISVILSIMADKIEWAVINFFTPETISMIGIENLAEAGFYGPVRGVPGYLHKIQVEAGRRRVNILPGARAEISVWGGATSNVYTFGDSISVIMSFCGSDLYVHANDDSKVTIRSYEQSNAKIETRGRSRSVVFADQACRVNVIVLEDSASEIIAVADSMVKVEAWGSSKVFISCGGFSCLRLETWRDSRVDVSVCGAALATVDSFDKSKTVLTCSESAMVTTHNRPGCDFQVFATGHGLVRDLTNNTITVPDMGLFLIKK